MSTPNNNQLNESTTNNQNNQTLSHAFICNHCSYEFKSKEDMKEHYKSQYHLYNLHRVTMQLNPVTYDEFQKRKATLEKASSLKNNEKTEKQTSQSGTNNYCVPCSKSFASMNKLDEHLKTKSHKQREVEKKELSQVKRDSEEKKEPTKTPIDNYLICFICNQQTSHIDDLMCHLKDNHHFQFPISSCISNMIKPIKLIITKIFKYGACLYCDSQKFPSPKAILNHMKDKDHVKICYEDIIDHFYKYYDKEKILKYDGEERRTKMYVLIKRMINSKEKKEKEKEIIEENGEEWEEVSENENENEDEKDNLSDIDDDTEEIKKINYVKLENGELLLKNGTVIGNRVYNTLYKQRIRYVPMVWKNTDRIQQLKSKGIINRKRELIKENKIIKEQLGHWKLKGSKKGIFERPNTLFKACKQVNC